MALYAFDGTWNEDEAVSSDDTNVVKFRDAYGNDEHQVAYIDGVGTRFGSIGRMLGGAFGFGGHTRIEEMYAKLVANWRDDDRIIDVIGFSRGAALAIHFTNVIEKCGIVQDDETLAEPGSLDVRFLGLWDTVGSFGIPINIVLKFQELDIGYDLMVPNSVQHCYHALALNERRQAYMVKRQNHNNMRDNITELWFRGVHGDVGGSSGNLDLSNISLQWMLEKAREQGLPIDQADIDRHSANNPFAPVSENLDPIKNAKRKVYPRDRIHTSAIGKRLATGQSQTFTVFAPEQYSWSGVCLEAGKHYSFTIAPDQKWNDAEITCGPSGWETEDLPWYKEHLVELFEGRRRCQDANWFELIGSIGDDEESFFRIGAGGASATYQALKTGELYAFPNDLRSMYGNNAGQIEVTITCEAAGGQSRLKACAED